MPDNRRMKKRNMRIGVTVIICLMFVIVFTQYQPIASWISRLTGEESKQLTDGIDKEQPVKLKVVYMDEGFFMRNYGKAFMLRYPNVSFEVLTAAPGDNRLSILEPDVVRKMLEQEQPDMLLMNPQAFERMAAEGHLAPLDAWIARDRFDLHSFDSRVADSLRQLAGGALYGLAPEVDRMGLFFNRTLFESIGVPSPTNRMSWIDVLQLAARFPADGSADKRIYGLSLPTPTTPGVLIDFMGRTNGLKEIDPVHRGLTMQTTGWQEIWSFALDGYKRGSVLRQKQPGKNPFLAGQVAMTVQPFRFVNNLLGASSVNFTWDLVTEPVNPANSDVSATFDIPMIYAVNAHSPAAIAAWELVKFINSKEIAAKQLRERQDVPLLSRRQQLLERLKSTGTSANIEAFYELKPRTWDFDPNDEVPAAFRSTLVEMMDQEAEEVLGGRKTLSEALQSMEQRAGDALIKSRGFQNK